MEAIDYFKKDGQNKFQNYSYISEAKVKREIRTEFKKHKLIVLPVGVQHAATVQTGDKVHGSYIFTYHIVDTESADGDYVVISTVGSGVDNGDKYAYKAMAGALKYALTQSFLIPTGDDPEVEREDERPVAKPVQKKDTTPSAQTMERTCPSCAQPMEYVVAGETNGKKYPAHYKCVPCKVKQR